MEKNLINGVIYDSPEERKEMAYSTAYSLSKTCKNFDDDLDLAMKVYKAVGMEEKYYPTRDEFLVTCIVDDIIRPVIIDNDHTYVEGRNFIIPSNVVNDSELYELFDKFDIGNDIIDSFVKIKYDNKKEDPFKLGIMNTNGAITKFKTAEEAANYAITMYTNGEISLDELNDTLNELRVNG